MSKIVPPAMPEPSTYYMLDRGVPWEPTIPLYTADQLAARDAQWAALLDAAVAQSGWMRAVDEAMVVHHIGIADPSDDYETAKQKLNLLLCNAQSIGAYFAVAQERERAVSACTAVRMDDGKAGQHLAWYAGIDACIDAIRAQTDSTTGSA